MTWPSWTSMGTSRWLEKAIASLSLKRQGMRRASTPLCANAIRTFQQCGLKRSRESAPANSYSVSSSAFMVTRPQQLRRSEEHTSELQSLMRISYAVFCLKTKKSLTHTQLHCTTKQTTTYSTICKHY